MLTEEISRQLPPGYEIQHSDRAWMATRRDAAQTLAQAGYGLHSDGTLSESVLAGRKPLLELATPTGVLLVRRFSHGGLLRSITGTRFSDPLRPFRELIASAALAELGVRTPVVVAARARRAAGFGWGLDLVTRRVEDSIDLGKLLGLARRGELERSRLRRVLTACGAFIRRLHDLGCLHADLTPNNMLVERASLALGPLKLWIVDLEGAHMASSLHDEERRDNLRRLLRFVARRENDHGELLTRTDFVRFMRGYDPDSVRWKSDWIAIQRADQRLRIWHHLGWMLESLWNKKQDSRERIPESVSASARHDPS